MPRQERTKSGTGIYHVMLRGINKQEVDHGFGPAVAEDGLTDVLFVVGWHGTVAAMVFVVALTVEMVDEMLLQQPQLLAGSNYPPDWDGPVGYTPGIADDKHQLA